MVLWGDVGVLTYVSISHHNTTSTSHHLNITTPHHLNISPPHHNNIKFDKWQKTITY